MTESWVNHAYRGVELGGVAEDRGESWLTTTRAVGYSLLEARIVRRQWKGQVPIQKAIQPSNYASIQISGFRRRADVETTVVMSEEWIQLH